MVLATLFDKFPFLKLLIADSAYQGPKFATGLAHVRPNLNVEIVKRSDRANGFVVLPKRWIVERSIAWLNRCRRLAKDWENRNRKALAFLRLASTACSENSAIQHELVGEVLVVMRDLAREGMTMVIVTHEMGFAREAATRVLFLDRGRVVETGSPDRFFSNPETERARQFLQRYAGDTANGRR